MRDSENILLDYDESSDEAAGITLPGTVAGWFEKAGYTDIENKTNLTVDKDLYNLIEANDHRLKGKKVCLFICADGIRYIEDGDNTIPDHWVVLTSDVQIEGSSDLSELFAKGEDFVNDDETQLAKSIAFTVYSWGEGELNINNPEKDFMHTVESWLEYYKGFISVKAPVDISAVT